MSSAVRPYTRRDRAADEHPAFSSRMMGPRDGRWSRWSVEVGGVRVEVHTDPTQWPPGADQIERLAFERELERALRRLVGPMKSAVQGSMFDEVTDDE